MKLTINEVYDFIQEQLNHIIECAFDTKKGVKLTYDPSNKTYYITNYKNKEVIYFDTDIHEAIKFYNGLF